MEQTQQSWSQILFRIKTAYKELLSKNEQQNFVDSIYKGIEIYEISQNGVVYTPSDFKSSVLKSKVSFVNKSK